MINDNLEIKIKTNDINSFLTLIDSLLNNCNAGVYYEFYNNEMAYNDVNSITIGNVGNDKFSYKFNNKDVIAFLSKWIRRVYDHFIVINNNMNLEFLFKLQNKTIITKIYEITN